MCFWDLQYFQSFRNSCLFSNIAHSVYMRVTVFSKFSKLLFLLHIFPVTKFLLPWLATCYLWQTLFNSSFPTLRTMCFWDLKYFQSFRNSCLFCTFWLIRNLNCADSDHTSYGERCSIHHFQHCAQCVYKIYSVFKVFEIAVCFAHFGLFEITTPVRRIMLTIANIV